VRPDGYVRASEDWIDTVAATLRQLDLRGLKCPLPVLRTRKAMSSVAPGDTLRVECTDPLAVIDIPHFVTESGHVLVEQASGDGFYTFVIRKGAV
jgi:tRNA 2-thiouridine synthesizing protein A